MQFLKSASLLFSLILLAGGARAESCFTNLASYEEVKSSLPASFQKNPLFLKCGNCSTPTGISVRVSAGGIMSTMMTGGAPDNSPVKKICIDGPNKLTIYGKYILPVVANGNSVVISSPIGAYNMTVTTQTALQQHLNGGSNTMFGSNGNR